MKAAVYGRAGAPEVLRYEGVPDPVCADDGVVIRVKAISVEGGDTINRATQAPPRPSYVVGYAASGEVVEVGRDVREFSVGQAATTMGMEGSHAELRAASARTTWAIPDGLDFGAAAAMPISFGTAHHCLFTVGRPSRGETVLIQGGAGGVGAALIRLAKQRGARVMATVSGAERAERLVRLGLDAAIGRRCEDVAAAVRRFTDGKGVDLAVDPVGGATLAVSLASLRPHGRLVFVGNAGGQDMALDLWPAMLANISLSGVFMGEKFAAEPVHRPIGALLDQMSRGEFEALVDRAFRLADASAAHRYIAQNQRLGRVLLVPWGSSRPIQDLMAPGETRSGAFPAAWPSRLFPTASGRRSRRCCRPSRRSRKAGGRARRTGRR